MPKPQSLTYYIPVTWQETGTMVIQAISLEAALEQAQQDSLPKGDYVEDSFEIDWDSLAECNPGLNQALIEQVKKQSLPS